MKKNNILEQACLIEPIVCQEGALCLIRDEDEQGWRIILNERGDYLINEFFSAEHDACRFILEHVLSEPTYRKDFKTDKFIELRKKSKITLKKYGFNIKK